MTGSSRKGLKRHGMRAYLIAGPTGRYIIERERPWRWALRSFNCPPSFWMQKFRRLGEARAVAEAYAFAKE